MFLKKNFIKPNPKNLGSSRPLSNKAEESVLLTIISQHRNEKAKV